MARSDRRSWLGGLAAAGAAAGVTSLGAPAHGQEDAVSEGALARACKETPNLLAHEHWGSLPSIGADAAGFHCDDVAGAATETASLFDLLLCPYLHGFLYAAGFDGGRLARDLGCPDVHALGRERPEELLTGLLPYLARVRAAGTLTCLREGLLALYGYDLDDLPAEGWQQLSARIGEHYRAPARWYRRAMAVEGLEGIIRPVPLSFLTEEDDPALAAEERAFTSTLLRIDDLALALPEPNRRMRFAIEATGIEPHDGPSWRAFLEAVFDGAAAEGCRGIKQFLAYRRDLRFDAVEESAIPFAGPANRALEDFVVRECTRLAGEREWPFQIHVGTHNLPHSNPLPLAALAREFPRVRFVLIHCWPYHREAATLAAQLPNVYLDTCWLPILSPAHLREALESYLGYVGAHKVTASQDATSVELAAGASRVTRRVLLGVLGERVADGLLREEQAADLARRILRENARELYGL